MKKLIALAVLVSVPLVLFVSSSQAHGDGKGKRNFSAWLSGYEEVPAISTNGFGQFKARVTDTEIQFSLSYEGLSGAPAAAHIHFAQPSVNGGVIAFLCGGGTKPACPASGPVTGTIVPADILGPAEQGIAPGEFEEAVRAMRFGVTYANVHTALFPNGEIRGQLRKGRGHDHFGWGKNKDDND